MAKVHLIQLLVVDHEEYDDRSIAIELTQGDLQSRILSQEVKLMNWDDSHPFNMNDTTPEKVLELFNKL